MDENSEFITVRAAARRLCVSDATVRRCLDDGQLEGIKVRGTIRVDVESIGKLIQRRRYYNVIRGVEPSAPSRWQRWRRLQGLVG
jgi:excisionase family DNA binding protein